MSNSNDKVSVQDEERFRQHAHQYSVRNNMTLDDHPKIEGYDLDQAIAQLKDGRFDLEGFFRSFSSTGFQATNLAEGIEITRIMQREKAHIFLTFTSNLVSSGLRDIFAYLARNKKIQTIVTSAGGIEEDIIKVLKPFVLGKFEANGEILFENGINRIGNIFVPNDRYALFDIFMQGFFRKLYAQKKIWAPHELIRELGLAMGEQADGRTSYLYWAAKNDISVFCPGIVDGSIGDLIVFFKQSHPDFVIDVSKEVEEITKIALNCETSAVIALGGGMSKHFALNANIFREGVDYAVYINTAQEYDGCDSGARIEEAISWGKVKAGAPAVKIHCDATIAFPLLALGGFKNP